MAENESAIVNARDLLVSVKRC